MTADLVGGLLVGPYTPGFVADREVAEQFARIGVILLLFGIGLRFHLRELLTVWRVAVPGALMQSTASTAVQGRSVTVVDLNLDAVRKTRAEGLTALYGDVLRPGTLEEAGIESASSLILRADVEDAAEVIRQARLLNPRLRVLARCTHLRDASALRRAGASVVAAGEAEVGVVLAEAVAAGQHADLRAEAEHREAVRARLYGLPVPGQQDRRRGACHARKSAAAITASRTPARRGMPNGRLSS